MTPAQPTPAPPTDGAVSLTLCPRPCEPSFEFCNQNLDQCQPLPSGCSSCGCLAAVCGGTGSACQTRDNGEVLLYCFVPR